jgi:putative ABC transport system permease protein
VLISEPFATKFGAGPGDRIVLPTPSGPTAFTVAAVYNDYSSDAGVVLLDTRTYRRLFHDDSVNSIAVYARPGTDLGSLRTTILRTLAPLRVDVATNRELRDLVVHVFDRTFAITYALDVIAIVIAVMGVVSTLFALVLERRTEFGLLRYVGVTIGGVRCIVLTEAAGIGMLGGLLGAGVGMLLALDLIFVINRQAFGWLIELHVPGSFLFETIVLVTVAAVLAGVYPAAVAARIRTADAVRSE